MDISVNSKLSKIDIVNNTNGNLSDLTEQLKNPSFRESLGSETLSGVIELFSAAISSIEESEASFGKESNVRLATESARFIRNACAGCKKNQDVLSRKPECFQNLHNKVKALCLMEKSVSGDVVTLLKCCLQMVGNATVQHEKNAALIWNILFDRLEDLFAVRDASLFSCACMVVHSCILASPTVHGAQLVQAASGKMVISSILDRLMRESQEWGLFIIQKLLPLPSFMENIYPSLDDDEHRHLLLDIVLSTLEDPRQNPAVKSTPSFSSPISNNYSKIAPENLSYVCEDFKQNAYAILGFSQAKSFEDKSSLVLKQLAVLCSSTSDPKTYQEVMDDKDLLKCAINLLHCIHMIGQEGDNPFANVSKVSELEDDEHTRHPVYGLKRDLIRLIANMTYKHRENQDMVRELGGIPLIMDHTNIDGRNPFITQWAVYAIRNLLDGNHDNQAVIAGMKLTGMADNVDKLREFGVEAELQDGRIVVKGVKDTEKSPFAK